MSILKWRNQNPMSVFNAVWDGFDNSFLNQGMEIGTSIPAVNIFDEQDKYRIDVAVPGCKKEDFEISVKGGNVLSLSMKHKTEKEEKHEGKFTRREFSYTSFQRSFQLPDDVEANNISAQYENGMLKIDLPKRMVAKKITSKIEVK